MNVTFVAGVVAMIAGSASAQIKVGVIGGVSTAGTQTVGQLNDDTYFNFDATLLSAADVDTLGEAQQYDVLVIGGSGFGLDPDYGASMWAAMRQYVDAGGGVVSVGWFNYLTDQLGGQSALDADYVSPIAAGGYSFQSGNPTVTLVNGPHPITDGLGNFQITPSLTETSVTNDATSLLLGTANGQAVILADDTLAGRRAYLGGLYMANEGAYGTQGLRSGNEDRLFEQAVAWAAVPAPGAVGLLGLAGLAMARRRR
jgi:hypothetical protein